MTDFPKGLLEIPPYSMAREDKRALLLDVMRSLCARHAERCAGYRRILDIERIIPENLESVEDVPFLPVGLFKDFSLKSVPESEIIKTVTSSGTSGQAVSKIYLDRETAANQTKVLACIVKDLLGEKRLPMLVIDSASAVKDRRGFSARGAGILGFSMYGRDIHYALNDDMSLDADAVRRFCGKYAEQPVFLFGFTFMVWQYFVKSLMNEPVSLPHGILLHGGGWKKLINESVTGAEFRAGVKRAAGVSVVRDYYGMAEQTGSIFTECGHGVLHASVFSDIITRSPRNFEPLGKGERGLIQTLSLIPSSYPGHSLLTEDEGALLGEDDCPCGRLGKYFRVYGRAANAELRGCGDTFTA